MSEAASSEILKRLDALESESAIRKVVARYFRICDDLGPETPLNELGELFAQDAKWDGKGRYADAFGGYDGRDAIVAMIGSYCKAPPHFKMTAHFFSAEDISVNGDDGSGQWMMLQTSTYKDNSADLRSAHLQMDFRRDDGVWRISRFQSTNIFSRKEDRWNDSDDIFVPDNSKDGARK